LPRANYLPSALSPLSYHWAKMNQYPQVYDLSKRYSPPKINLRDAEILDGCGDGSHATHSIDHRIPENVSRVDLDAYGWGVYSFMEFRDLLFYFYPVALEYARDNQIDCIDPFLYSLDRFIPEEMLKIPEEGRKALVAGLQWMWKAGQVSYADWLQCRNLQKVIGVSVSQRDLYKRS